MKRTYRVGDVVIEHDPDRIPQVIQLGTIRKAIKQVALTSKKHFKGIPSDQGAVNCALARLGAKIRVTVNALLCVDDIEFATSKKYGKNTLKEWVLEALLAEERYLKTERTA